MLLKDLYIQGDLPKRLMICLCKKDETWKDDGKIIFSNLDNPLKRPGENFMDLEILQRIQLDEYSVIEVRKPYTKQNSTLFITKMVTISTTHISEKTAHLLEVEAKENNLGICVYNKADFGWYITIDDEIKRNTDLPKDLYKAIQFASDVGCQTLCLDCDGTVVGFLDKYDW